MEAGKEYFVRVELSMLLPLKRAFQTFGSIAEFVGERAMEEVASWKGPKTGLSTALGNPAKAAGFPLLPQPRRRRVNLPI
jgi:hypothetical protein